MADRIEVGIPPDRPDPAGESLRITLHEDLGVTLDELRIVDVYTIDAALSSDELARVQRELFTDPIIQISTANRALEVPFDYVVEVGFRPGVTDNVGRSSKQGIQDVLGRALAPHEAVYTSKKYLVRGCARETAEHIAQDALANDLIEQWVVKSRDELPQDTGALLPLPVVTERSEVEVKQIALDCADDGLLALSRSRTLALDLGELQAIRSYFAHPDVRYRREGTGLPPNPTDIEIEVLAQTWSEHCKHKIFAAEVVYTDPQGNTRVIDGLFKTYVRATTEAVAKNVDWLVSVFHDNAGIIRFDEQHYFALKVETHNSPSALDPYGGAMTGIVGVNRDILGAGLGCRCILNTDVFCFASPYYNDALPERLLHPRRVLRGVHRGVKDGGNESGIPTVNGAIVFHERFLGKPLVFCGTGGLIPATIAGRPSEKKAARPGDIIVMCGGRIGKDGIHGATFSSEELHEGSPATAVQIGDPITQKKMADMLIEARDRGLFTAITDNGAGGLSSSIGEMARASGGAKVYLDSAPLKYAGLAPWEIFLSEAQERMTLAIPPQHLDTFLELSARREVESTAIGEFTDSKMLECFYDGKLICSLDMDFLHDGLPRMHLLAELDPGAVTARAIERGTVPLANSGASPNIPLNPPSKGDFEEDPQPSVDSQEPGAVPSPRPRGERARVRGLDDDSTDLALTEVLKSVLSSLNVCSKEAFVRMYDHEVQGHSVLKPFQGILADGPGDAAVIRPVPDSNRGLALACGICPKYSDLDTYRMMACAIDEAVRNLICVGAKPGTIAGLDNFCWPDPVESEKTPDGRHKLAQLVRCCEALYDTCVAYGVPLISGKDSMKNDYNIGGVRISIPPTVLFTACGVVEDITRCVTMDVKRPGDIVYVLGETKPEMGGSEFYALRGITGGEVPAVDAHVAKKRYERLHTAITNGLIASCHDCSDGGLGVALAESAFAGGLGMKLDLTSIPLDDNIALLFSESQSRFVVTVHPEYVDAITQIFPDDALCMLGEVTSEPYFNLHCYDNARVVAPLEELKTAWQAPLRW